MAAISIIRLSSIEYSRIDSEFYQPTYISDGEKFKKTKFKFNKLSKFISKPVRTGSTPKNRLIFKDEEIVSFIKTNTLREGKIVYDSVEYLPKRSIRASDYIKDNSILVTIIGATKDIVGRVAIKEKKDPISTTNQNVGIIEFKDSINPYFGMIYLQSDYGRHQLWRHSRQTEQVNLNCREIERVLFPEVSVNIQSVIGDLVKNSFELQFKSTQIYKQAEELLNKELGLDTLVFDKPKSYVANFSEVVENLRADADFYQTKFKQLSNHLSSLETEALGKLCSFRKGYEVGSKLYTENGPLFIRVSNLTKDGFKIGNSDKYISNQTYSQFSVHQPKVGDILLTKDGTIGTCYVVDEEVKGIISSGILNLDLRNLEIPKEYLALVINSKVCSMQADRDCSGALITHWKPEQIRKMRIPILSKEVMDELSNLVIASKKARKESIQLLEEAKKQVEDLIENQANQN